MPRWWKRERSRWVTRSSRSALPTQQKDPLLAQQVPGPPRRVEAQRPPPGVERHRLFHPGTDDLTEFAEILDGAEVDVGRIPPGIGQVVGVRHLPAEQNLQADLP